jgi:hypothetical protein
VLSNRWVQGHGELRVSSLHLVHLHRDIGAHMVACGHKQRENVEFLNAILNGCPCAL